MRPVKPSCVIGFIWASILLFAPTHPLVADATEDPNGSPVRADRVLVLKSLRTMQLLKDGEVLREYKISLGANPKGPKTRRGDNKTPEGEYIIEGRIANSAFHRALRISYPNIWDLFRAYERGVKPGGNITIHGLPNGVTNKYRMKPDWTKGCIAVSNEEIEEIWELVPDGTPIEIRP